MMSATSAGTADTFGWDTAFVLPIAAVNAAIAAAKASPATFRCSGKDALSGEPFSIFGTFGDWQIATGGSGSLLQMRVPLSTLNVKAATLFSFTGGSAVIQIRLQFVPQADATGAGGGALQDLIVDTAPASGDDAVSILALSFPDDAAFVAFEPVVTPPLQGWFNDHLIDFAYVFNTVNLGMLDHEDAFSWLLPTSVSYAYIDRPATGDGLFGVLAMTGGRSASGLSEQLSPNAIPSGSAAAFLISQDRFLSDLLVPALPHAFPGVDTSDFSIPSGSANVTLDAATQLAAVAYQGSTYTPLLQSLTVSLAAQTLQIEAVTQTEVSWQIWSNCHTVSTYEIQLAAQSGGGQTLTFQQVGVPVIEHWPTTGVGIEITEIIGDILVSVGAIVIGALTGGAGFLVAALVAGLLVGIGNQIPNIVATIGTDNAPPVTMLLLNATGPIQWTGYRNFRLTSAGLSISLQLGGTFEPA